MRCLQHVYIPPLYQIFCCVIQIQLLVNDHVARLNTRLISVYSSQHACVRPLVLAVQQWARVRGCGNPDNATLSPYGWTLLVINFLRLQEKEVIASIENMEKSGVLRNNARDARVGVSTISTQSSPAENSQSEELSPTLGVLLLQFFLFYGTCSSSGFQPFHSIVTIRNQHRVFKRDSHFTNEANSTLPCMTALEAIQAVSPEESLQKLTGNSPRRSVAPAADNDVDDGSDFIDEENTDRVISSNTSSHQSRSGRRQQMLVYKSDILPPGPEPHND